MKATDYWDRKSTCAIPVNTWRYHRMRKGARISWSYGTYDSSRTASRYMHHQQNFVWPTAFHWGSRCKRIKRSSIRWLTVRQTMISYAQSNNGLQMLIAYEVTLERQSTRRFQLSGGTTGSNIWLQRYLSTPYVMLYLDLRPTKWVHTQYALAQQCKCTWVNAPSILSCWSDAGRVMLSCNT